VLEPYARVYSARLLGGKETEIPADGIPSEGSYRVSRQLCPSCPVLCALLLFAVLSQRATADSTFIQINLVSDVMGCAENYDPNLKNPWGIAFAVNSPFWISNQASDTATLYDGAGNTIPLVVGIPPVGFPTGPTGQVFNSNSSFNLPDGSPAHFLFDTLDGRILGWNGGATAVTVAIVAGAV
jgi:hypothetical protein